MDIIDPSIPPQYIWLNLLTLHNVKDPRLLAHVVAYVKKEARVPLDHMKEYHMKYLFCIILGYLFHIGELANTQLTIDILFYLQDGKFQQQRLCRLCTL